MTTPLFLCAGVHVILQREQRVFLLLRQNSGFGDGQYCFPEGRLEPGESPRQAAARELKEETGIRIDPAALRFGLTLYEQQRSTNTYWVRFFFYADSYSGEPHNAEPKRCKEAGWFPLNALPENLFPFDQHALEALQQNLPYAEFGWE